VCPLLTFLAALAWVHHGMLIYCIESIGKVLASETRAKRASVLVAPTVDIPRFPVRVVLSSLAVRYDVMPVQLGMCRFMLRCFFQDPFLNGMWTRALVKGLQGEGIAAHLVINISYQWTVTNALACT
jgi:hypothetical protein